MLVYAAISTAGGGGSWMAGDVGLWVGTRGVLWRAYWLALVVSVPGV